MDYFNQRIARALGPDFVFEYSRKYTDGNLSFRYAQSNQQTIADVADNRRAFLGRNYIGSEQVVIPHLVHGLHTLQAADHLGKGVLTLPGDELQADIVVADEMGQFAGYGVADCVVIAFAAPGSTKVVSAHIGWRSIELGILAAIKEQILQVQLPLDTLVTIIGPCQHIAYMETVGPDLQKPGWDNYITGTEKGYYEVLFLLRLMNDLAQNDLGNQIICCPEETYTNTHLWSHARSVKSGGAEPEGRTLVVTGYR